MDSTKEYFEILRSINNLSIDEFINDKRLQLQGERIFEIIAQVILDICTHIVAKSDVNTPTSYSDCINSLNKLGILNEQTTTEVVSLIKMRNLIVHQYGIIDYQLLFDALQRLESTFISFKDAILKYLPSSS